MRLSYEDPDDPGAAGDKGRGGLAIAVTAAVVVSLIISAFGYTAMRGAYTPAQSTTSSSSTGTGNSTSTTRTGTQPPGPLPYFLSAPVPDAGANGTAPSCFLPLQAAAACTGARASFSISAAVAAGPGGSAQVVYSVNATGWSASCRVGSAYVASGAVAQFAAGTDLLTCHVDAAPAAPPGTLTVRLAAP